MKVTKRDGSLEKFDTQKIKRAINWACEDLEVNPLLLECKIDEIIFDGIPTSRIHENVIAQAKGLCSAQEPDWTIVAGRLLTMKYWSEIGAYEDNLYTFIQKMKDKGLYAHEGIFKYTKEEMLALGGVIVHTRDLDHSYASVTTAMDKYLLKGEPIQYMFMVQAMIIASVEKTPQDRMLWAVEFYDWLSKRKISLATPWLSNLRSNKNIASCFIIGSNDDLDSIFDTAKNEARISKEGGGIGIFLGALRARGSSLMGVEGVASGIVGWSKIYNDTALFVNQAGKRQGAATLALPIWHADVVEFLDIQTEAGDQRNKCYDIQPQLTIPDLFMEMKESNTAIWYTFCPHEVLTVTGEKMWDVWGEEFESLYKRCVKLADEGVLKVVRKIGAKDLFKLWMRVLLETGLPYGFYVDNVNRRNPNKHVGMIYCGNLCQESYSVFKLGETAHTCSLASVVVGRVAMSELADASGVCVRILDNGLELTRAPIEESKRHMDSLRTIGVGIQGYHDIVARENKSFYDEDFLDEVFGSIAYGAVRESIRLAKERGEYPLFDGSDWDNGAMFDRYREVSKNPEMWDELQEACQQYGIRNSQTMSPAPNTSTSLFMDAAAGVLPVYSSFFLDENKSGTLSVAAMYLKENPLSYANSFDKHIPSKLAKLYGRAQKHVDTGISTEYLMNKNQEGFNVLWLRDALHDAWKHGNNAVYYVRSLKKGETLTRAEEDCASCAG